MHDPGDPLAHEQLLAAARRGEDAALQQLLCRYVDKLRAYIRLHSNAELRAHESCSDVVQSVCRECLVDLPDFRFESEAAFRKWLFQKAMSKLVDRHRHWQTERRNPAREEPDSQLQVPARLSTASQLAIGNEELARLEASFSELPEEYRRVIVASRLVGQSHAEIAAELGRTEGAVRMLLHRALARLAAVMDRISNESAEMGVTERGRHRSSFPPGGSP
jgi:RNA polymerase sigma-70 factor (ECF subfamily)